MKKIQRIGLLFILVSIVTTTLFLPVKVFAADPPADLNCKDNLSPAGRALFCNGQENLTNDSNSLNVVINFIATWLVGLIGVVLAVVILVSAVQIVASGGSPEAMKGAKNRLTQAAISLGLLISFRAILALIGI